ncbi:hypothetical protein JTB14_021591 [Gonioctena quinquepunctata]|nr:hypothetical protein JTB14_021591 [Gonioctena quinquepunctata]
MKARSKKKKDVKKTCNKPIKLLPWKKALYKAMEGDSSVDQCEKTATAAIRLPLSPRRTRAITALSGETEETEKLSNLKLQQLVLLQQLQTTRVQRDYYESKIKKGCRANSTRRGTDVCEYVIV